MGNLYEKIVTDADIREINYIFADGKTVAFFETSEENDDRTLYLHHDHLGSVMAFSNENGQTEEELSYDAWGRRRSPSTWEPFTFSDDDTSDYDQGFTGHEHIDLFDMVNMDGRMYDPVVGRFLSPDPYIQMPDFTQSLNRYAYCINNPLSLTDPTGYNWFGDFFAVAVGIAVGIETGGLGAGIYGAIIGGTLGGASAALVGSVLNGANLWQTTKNVFVGAFWGAAGGAMNFEIGEIRNVFARIAVHSVSEGFVEGIQGGHFEHGLLLGLTSSTGGELISRYGSNLPYAGQIAANAALGGLVSELGGGKFANGAMTAAYTMMFNELMHQKQIRRLTDKQKFIGQVPLESKIGFQTATYVIDVTLISSLSSDGYLSIEASGVGSNTPVEGIVKGAFEVQLLADGKTIQTVAMSKHYNSYIVDSRLNINFIGEAKLQNIKMCNYNSINVCVSGNWYVEDSCGLGRSIPVKIFSKRNIFYNHSFKIK